MIRKISIACLAGSTILMAACGGSDSTDNNKPVVVDVKDSLAQYASERLAGYAKVKLTTDLSQLSEKEKQMLPLLIEASQIMDELYWQQNFYGNKDSFINSIKDPNVKAFAEINYGPWDKLNNEKSFVAGWSEKYIGAGFYPVGLTKEELEKSDVKDKFGQYSLIRRDSTGKLYSVPYHIAFKPQLDKASALLNQAAALAEDAGLKKYLTLRAKALLDDNYTASDIAWLDMKSNGIDIIIGPIENYEDGLYESRNAYEAYVLVKDKVWSERLSKYVKMLPELQKGLPVEDKYKAEAPGTDSELNAYDVVYYAGHCNSGSKTIAVNLPNDETIQKNKGTRRSQLKNAMKAKYDQILAPIAEALIDDTQIKLVNFDAFFANVMFHEVAHGLGIKTTIDGKGTVRAALQEQGSWLEEAKADILGLYMVTKLVEKGELAGKKEEFYTTFMAGILRSVRFGASKAHGKANMLAFNFFEEKGAFEKTAAGKYKVNFVKFEEAMNGLSNLIITMQGNGSKVAVENLQKEKAIIKPSLQTDLDGLASKGIPVDVVFEQGVKVLGL